jgi:bacillithiol system protein YtxJ
MGFLKKLWSTSEPKETKILPWISLTDIYQLDLIPERSKTKIQIIFKYSTRCGINRMMLNRFVDAYDFSETEADLYYLDIINYRNISNVISHKFQVLHESPQVLVIKNGGVVANQSHGNINHWNLKAFIGD